MFPSTGDFSPIYKSTPTGLSGVLATHVDDTLGVGTRNFLTEYQIIERTFNYKPRSWNNALIGGLHIQYTYYGFFVQWQGKVIGVVGLVYEEAVIGRWFKEQEESSCSLDQFLARRQ